MLLAISPSQSVTASNSTILLPCTSAMATPNSAWGDPNRAVDTSEEAFEFVPPVPPSANAAGRGGGGGGRGPARGGGRGRGGRGGRGRGRGRGEGRGAPTDSAAVCTFFLQNRCARGESCRFRHEMPSADNSAASSSQQPTAGAPAPTKRVFDPYKAEAISRAKLAQDAEPRPWSTIDGPFYSIDVECVATGYGHGTAQRIPGRIAMVDGNGDMVLDELVRHDAETAQRIVSYITPLTGLTREACEADSSKTIEEISELIRTTLPKDAVLVGQSIDHDIEWLGLQKGVDYRDFVDLADIFANRIPKILLTASNAVKRMKEGGGEDAEPRTDLKGDPEDRSSDAWVGFPTRYRIFGLRHCCVHLLSVDMQQNHHDPVDDARYSILLFNKYQKAPGPMLRAVRDSLHRAPITAGFAAENPVVDGVCMSRAGYIHKHAARFIWRWWLNVKGRR